MDAVGIAGIQARIAQIEARFAMPAAPTTTSTGAPATTGTSAGSFANALKAEMTKGTTAAGHAHAHADAPSMAELERYGNGRIPASAMESIGVGQHRLWGPAATSFKRMQSAARAAGVDIGVTDSYRSYDAQVDVARRKGLYSQGGLAATPGTSNHGWGRALDLDLDSRAQAWMRANAGRFGFVEDVPREPWHWTYKP